MSKRKQKQGVPPSQRKPRKTWQEAVAYAAGAQVALHRHRSKNDDEIRKEIAKAFEDGLKDRGDFCKVIDVEGLGPTDVMSMAGMFRLIFNEWNLNRADQVAQESWWAVAKEAMEKELRRPPQLRGAS